MAEIKQVQWPKVAEKTEVDAKADLRGVHWQLGYRQFPRVQSESKLRYVPQPNPATLMAHGASHGQVNLRGTHIDLAFGADKSCRQWQTVQTGDMSRYAREKFACEKPHGNEVLGAELRKSSISLSGREQDELTTEQKQRFRPLPPIQRGPLTASILGKDLRASHIDLANGQQKTSKSWQGMQNSEMALHAREKFACEKPANLEELSRDLRKSSVPLGNLNAY